MSPPFAFRLLQALALSALFISSGCASPLVERDTTTIGATTTPTAALVETTIDGKLTTLTVGAPTTTTSRSAAITTSDANSTTGSGSSASSTAPSSPSNSLIPSNTLQACHDATTGPFCLPANESVVNVGDTYWVSWNPDLFPVNATITIGLNYANNSDKPVWTSKALPKEAGFTSVTMDNAWLDGWDYRNLSFILISFTPASNHAARPFDGPLVKLVAKPVDHLPPPPPTKPPSKASLLIGLPVSLGFCVLVVLGLFFGMRAHRKIGLPNVMGRGSRGGGYGTGRSRRQRMGLKKGAIQLEDREPEPTSTTTYRDEDEITPAPAQHWQQHQQQHQQPHQKLQMPSVAPQHQRDVSLGSLLTDDEPNAFRLEIENQKSVR